MISGTNAPLMGSYNTRVVLELIRREGEASRADVARAAGLSLQAVSTIFGRLESSGWIVAHGRRSTGRGQPPLVYRLNAGGRAMIGVAVDLDGVRSAIVGLDGEIRIRRFEACARPGSDDVHAAVVAQVRDLERAAASEGITIVGVGVAIPGTPDPATGRVRSLPHIDGWDDVPLLDDLRADLDLPVHVSNDAIAAALGESWFEPGSDDATFYVFFAHGLNGAMIDGGRPYGGIWGIAGKFGHIPVEGEGRPCPGCGGRGCVETCASLISLYEALGLPTEEASLELVTAMHEAGDSRVHAWIQRAGRSLATALLAVENLFDPATIAFGGRLPRPILESLVAAAERDVTPRRMKVKVRHPRYRLMHRTEDAAVVGAAALPPYLAFSPDLDLIVASGEEAVVLTP